jgi:hypothetical protein
METFHITVLSIAAILLILLLTFIGILMSHKGSSQVFPVERNDCPDFWEVYIDPESNGSSKSARTGKCIIPSAKSKLNCGNIYSGELLNRDIAADSSITPGFNSVTQDDNSIVNFIDFNDKGWAGGICVKRTWARNQQIEWDGVSNYNSC